MPTEDYALEAGKFSYTPMLIDMSRASWRMALAQGLTFALLPIIGLPVCLWSRLRRRPVGLFRVTILKAKQS